MKKTIKLIVVALMGSLGVVQAQENIDLKPLEETAFAGEYYDLSKVYFANTASVEINSDGTLSGGIVSLHENGNLDESGRLLLGHKHGEWLKYSEDGVLLNQAKYNEGKKDGAWKVWDENGTLRLEFHYEDGKRVGVWKMYDETGNLESEQVYSE